MSKKTFRQLLLLLFFAVLLFFFATRLSAVKQALAAFWSGIKPLTIGLVLAFVLNIVLRYVEKILPGDPNKHRGLRRAAGIIATYILFFSVIAVLLTVLIPQLSLSVQSLYAQLPEYYETLTSFIDSAAEKLGIKNAVDSIIETNMASFGESVSEYTRQLGAWALKTGIGFGKSAFELLLGTIISVYILAAKESLRDGASRLTNAVFKPERAEKISYAANLICRKFSLFIGGQVLDAAILGGLCLLGMLIIGLPYATLVGMLIAVTALVPIIGAWAGGAVCTLIILMESPVQAIIFLIFIVALQQFENNLIYPKIVGDALGISGLWVLVGVTVGGALFGLGGMILGAPAVAVVFHYIELYLGKKSPYIN